MTHLATAASTSPPDDATEPWATYTSLYTGGRYLVTNFESLVRQHQAAVCATAYAVLRDRARSEEVAQDAFLLAWRKLPAMQPPPVMPAWICGIARNLARNAARKHRETPMTEHVTEPAAAATPLDTALSREHADLANRALATLSDDDRELVVLYYRCDESIAGVATTLAISEVTARKRLQRTRGRLRDALVAVEATLRATRPGPAFTVACVAALAAGHVPDAAAATATTSTTIWGAKPLVLVAIGSAVLVAASAIALLATVSPAASSRHVTSTPTLPTPATTTEASRTQPTPRTDGAGYLARISVADRAALLARVHAKRTTAAPPTGVIAPKVFDFADTNLADTTLPDPAPTGPLGTKTLRYAIKLMHPMLLACRTDADVHGRLAMKMRISGAETGSVVESVEVTGDPPLSDDVELVECVRTTLETLELPPMDDVAPWDVYYPFAF